LFSICGLQQLQPAHRPSQRGYTYDNNGNTLTKTDGTGTTNYNRGSHAAAVNTVP
jgi:hypothetical protein